MYERKCPECNTGISYKNKYNMIKADLNNSMCRSCINKKVWTVELCKKISDKNSGSGNPFYGKHHTKESIDKYVNSRKKSYNDSKYITLEFKETMSKINSGKNNSMYGKSVYSVWLKKYGKEKADELNKKFKEKLSKLFSGKNNPMYGKPSPQGSGNGWSGWYKGWFFRSLRELSYMINVIEKYNMIWESAERGKYKIKYIDYIGNEKNYFPDFIIENKYIIEIKPKKLWNTNIIKLKKKAAIKWCNNNGYIYKLRDIKIDGEKIMNLYKNNKIRFLKKYERLFLERNSNEVI